VEGSRVRRFGAPVGREYPAVVEEHDAVAQQAPALLRVADDHVGRRACDIAGGRALRFMGAHGQPPSGCCGLELAQYAVEATEIAQSRTDGQGADATLITVGVLKPEHVGGAVQSIRKAGTVVVVSGGPAGNQSVPLDLRSPRMGAG
jgi:hypothetical protein